jgi:hypothetical protein
VEQMGFEPTASALRTRRSNSSRELHRPLGRRPSGRCLNNSSPLPKVAARRSLGVLHALLPKTEDYLSGVVYSVHIWATWGREVVKGVYSNLLVGISLWSGREDSNLRPLGPK